MFFIPMPGGEISEENQARIAAVGEKCRAMLDDKLKDLEIFEQKIVNALVEAREISGAPSYDAKLAFQVRTTDLFFELLGELKPGRRELWESRAKEITAGMRELEADLQKELTVGIPKH